MIREITFKEIYPVWQTKLWPERNSAIEKMNGMMLQGRTIKISVAKEKKRTQLSFWGKIMAFFAREFG